MRHIALEGRCFVLSACQFSQEKDYPDDHAVTDASDRNAENVMIAGGSVIVNPLGEVLAGPLLGKEGILVADLDLDDVVRGKFDLDVVGHYARPDGESFPINASICYSDTSLDIKKFSSFTRIPKSLVEVHSIDVKTARLRKRTIG
jgi:hypothetical protein